MHTNVNKIEINVAGNTSGVSSKQRVWVDFMIRGDQTKYNGEICMQHPNYLDMFGKTTPNLKDGNYEPKKIYYLNGQYNESGHSILFQLKELPAIFYIEKLYTSNNDYSNHAYQSLYVTCSQ